MADMSDYRHDTMPFGIVIGRLPDSDTGAIFTGLKCIPMP
jgi:hypothetical protein